MLPIAHISPTSVLVPMILTRTWVLGSMTVSSLLVNCGGVALGSHLMSLGINCPGSQSLQSAPHPRGARDVRGPTQTASTDQPERRSLVG